MVRWILPTQNMRSKTKIIDDFTGKVEDCPIGPLMEVLLSKLKVTSSDCLLKPVTCYPDPVRENGFLVMTEVLNADGSSMNQMQELK